MAGNDLRVLLDGTPMLGARTGTGRYTSCLVRELAAMSTMDVSVMGLTARGWHRLRATAPEGARTTGIPVIAKVVRACWARGDFPPVELLARSADVLHGTNFVLPPALRGRGVVTVHDLAFLDSPEELPAQEQDLPELVRRSVHRAAVVCTPTAAVADVVHQRFGVPVSRIVVTPLGVDREWFDATSPDSALRREYRLPEDYLVFVGADGPRKGLATLHRALGPGLPPLVLVGPGEAAQDSRTLRTGYVPEEVLRRIVAGARALVLPSREEGFGLPTLEALACGVPVVCSDIPALREVTADHAVLFSYGEPDALRAALHDALALPHEDATARRAHAATFTWRACAEATVAAYRLALS
jgi:glycosyltransferase involved in cell wall biosynthesis